MFAQPTFPASVLRRASTSELLDLKNSSSASGFGCSPSWLFALGIRWSSLVCDGLVSVSVRPERLSAAGTTRDTGHHSRFVPSFLVAAAARGIGVDGASCGKSLHRCEPLTRGSGVRRLDAMAEGTRTERERSDRVAWSEITTCRGGRHVGLSPATDPDMCGCAGAECASSLLARAAS